jgi:beta-N-acetylhexosaminidase
MLSPLSAPARVRIDYNSYPEGTDGEDLWAAALGHLWPLRERGFFLPTTRLARPRHTLGGKPVRVSAHFEGKLIGHASARSQGESAYLLAILVHPQHQRRGVGTRLLNNLMSSLHDTGARKLILGTHIRPYFWPGVPADLAQANRFFDRCGFARTQASVDLVCDLHGFTVPARVSAAAQRMNVDIAVTTKSDINDVVAYWHRVHPQGYPNAFTRALQHPQSMIFARSDNQIVGVCILDPSNREYSFPAILPGDCGAISCLSIDPRARASTDFLRTALSAHACQVFKEAGLRSCLLAASSDNDLAALGFKVLRSYRAGARRLQKSPPRTYYE